MTAAAEPPTAVDRGRGPLPPPVAPRIENDRPPAPPHAAPRPAPTAEEIVKHPLVKKAVELFGDRTPKR